MILSDKWHKRLMFVAQILLPALGTLYFGLAAIWNLPAPEKIIGSITVVDTFLGVLLGISTNAYTKSDSRYAGSLNVMDGVDKKVYTLELNVQPEELEKNKEAIFKVTPR